MERSKGATDVHCKGGEGSRANHMLIVVGWGETDGGEKYWLIQNSWVTRGRTTGASKLIVETTVAASKSASVRWTRTSTSCSTRRPSSRPTAPTTVSLTGTRRRAFASPRGLAPGVAGEDGYPGCEICGIDAARTMVSSTPKRARARARMGMVGPSARRALLRTSLRENSPRRFVSASLPRSTLTSPSRFASASLATGRLSLSAVSSAGRSSMAIRPPAQRWTSPAL